MVLIRLRVESADLPLSKRVVESGVDLIGGDAKPRSCRPVIVQLHAETVVLLVRRNFGNLRQLAQFHQHLAVMALSSAASASSRAY